MFICIEDIDKVKHEIEMHLVSKMEKDEIKAIAKYWYNSFRDWFALKYTLFERAYLWQTNTLLP